MKRELEGGYELDDDRARVNIAVVHAYLSRGVLLGQGPAAGRRCAACWTRRRAVVGALRARRIPGGLLPASSRTARSSPTSPTSSSSRPPPPAAALGLELVREAVDGGPQADLRWLLGTEDAQGFYSKLGFGKPAEIMLERGPADG